MATTRPAQIDNLQEKNRRCIERKQYKQSMHAIERQTERKIDLSDALYVLKNGYHEKRKTVFDEQFKSWKYAIRGKTLDDDLDIRIIVSFIEENMLVITVMHVT